VLVILKATTACNLGCAYCYGEYGGKESGEMLSVPTATAFARQLPSILNEREVVEILWHGGEPTLVAPEVFAEIQQAFDDVLTPLGHSVSVSMQSNGFSISQQWRETIRRFDVGLGISMDGPVFLQDARRRTKRGTPSGAEVAKTIRALLDERIYPSLLCVVSAEHVAHVGEITDWIEEMRLPVRFNPLFASGRAQNAISPKMYFGFLRALFGELCERSIESSVQPLKWMLEAVLYEKPPTECSFDGRCGEAFVSLFPSGDVGVCGRSNLVYGNITEKTLAEMWAGTARKRLLARQEYLAGHCAGCAVRHRCHGGCQAIFGDAPQEEYCEALRELFLFLATDGMSALRQSIVAQRDKIKAELRQLKSEREILLARSHERSGNV
jgi:radical SAM protein with 4Fe4S-binding SPASM domain